MNDKSHKKADVCLILEGTYPYVIGGVSNWAHDLIKMQSHLTFHILTLIPEGASTDVVFDIPENVIGSTTITLQEMKKGASKLPKKEHQKLFASLKDDLFNILDNASAEALESIITSFKNTSKPVGHDILLNSKNIWQIIEQMYMDSMRNSSFLDFFWSWRTLFGGLFSILLSELPDAKVYHSLCTGYAGLMLARAGIEKNAPVILTEHGIYTNERRIEITAADWIKDSTSFNLSVTGDEQSRELRQFWSDMFTAYSKMCYHNCDKVVTLFGENQRLQIREGANKEHCEVIPNGVDYERFSKIIRSENHPPTVALIGRVVPIKDVKTFINAVIILKKTVPDCRAFILGPTEEDEEYYEECKALITHSKCENDIVFTGRVRIDDYLPEIDIIALTSISEAQPLVILEAGAAKIPAVATNVGSCKELLYGVENEDPKLGVGGVITKLADPQSVADAMAQLMNDKEFYKRCSENMQKRVKKYYNKSQQKESYKRLYDEMIELSLGEK